MKWARRLLVLSIVVAALSLWLPWVWDRSSALVLTGLDVAEFARFMGQVRTGAIFYRFELFAVPLVAVSLLLAAWCARAPISFWGRMVAVLVAFWLLTVVFPPLERRAQLLTAAAIVGLGSLFASFLYLKTRLEALFLPLLALIATVPPLAQFATLYSAISALYGKPISPGAGVYTSGVALILAIVTTPYLLFKERR